ncbi:hypothetical protein ACU4GD_11015 [Cupriavidus basilensis]
MDSALLLGLALGLVSFGVGVTFLIATRVPTLVLVRAQEHGRFAGLGASQETAGRWPCQSCRPWRERGTPTGPRLMLAWCDQQSPAADRCRYALVFG